MVSLTTSTAAIVVAFCFLRICYTQWRRTRYMANLPWLGIEGRAILPKLRARLSNLKDFENKIKGAYEQYSLQDQLFVLPTLADDLILLPPSHMDWLIDQPDNIISHKKPIIEQIQGEYTFAHLRVITNPIHHYVIHREMTRQLGNHTKDIMDELSHAVDQLWPKDEARFQDVSVFETIMMIATRTSNRIFVGLPYCRQEEYLKNLMGYVHEMNLWSAILRQLPSAVRPLVAKFCLVKLRRHIRAFVAQIRPEIEKRQAALANSDLEKDSTSTRKDALQGLIVQGEEHGGIERDPQVIAARLLALNFAAMHTTSFSMTNVIFDIVASQPQTHVLDQLRHEAEQTLHEHDGLWTKAALSRMYKMDSTLRESQRLGSFLGVGMMRQVVAKEGVTTPGGIHLPYGSKIAFPSYGIHNDRNTYPGTTYDPFRFSRLRTDSPTDTDTENETASSSSSNKGSYIQRANLAFVSTNVNYHPFGHGKHGCPGRFFAATELKLLLAYLVTNYDFEPLEIRPRNRWYGPIMVPPLSCSIKVRRRRRRRHQLDTSLG